MKAGAKTGAHDGIAGSLAMLLQLRGGGNELDAYFPMRVQGVSGPILTFAALTGVVMEGRAGAFCRYNSSTSRVTTLLAIATFLARLAEELGERSCCDEYLFVVDDAHSAAHDGELLHHFITRSGVDVVLMQVVTLQTGRALEFAHAVAVCYDAGGADPLRAREAHDNTPRLRR